jgi:hypothetical protein
MCENAFEHDLNYSTKTINKMKTKLLLLILTCLAGQIALSQINTSAVTSTTETATKAELNDIKDQLADIKKIIKNNGKDQSAMVGTLVLRKSNEVIQYGRNKTIERDDTKENRYFDLKKNIKLDSVTILTKD